MRTFIVAALAVLAAPIVVPSPSEARVIGIVVEQKRPIGVVHMHDCLRAGIS